MKFYSTNPDSMFFAGEAIRAEIEERPLARQIARVVATVAERVPGSEIRSLDRAADRVRSWASDLHYWATYGSGRYPGGRVFY